MLRYAQARLPKYAVPVFLRVVKTSTHIHNYKQNKVPLRKEGVEPEKVGTESPAGKDDQLLWLSPESGKYEQFGHRQWEKLVAGKVRF